MKKEISKANDLAGVQETTEKTLHDLGSCLNVISVRTELAMRRLESDHPAQRELEIVLGQVDRATDLARILVDVLTDKSPT